MFIAEGMKKVDGMTAKQIEIIVDTVVDGIKEAVALGEKIEIRGFGNFRIKQRNGRVARNSKTGELVQVPLKKASTSKPIGLFTTRSTLINNDAKEERCRPSRLCNASMVRIVKCSRLEIILKK